MFYGESVLKLLTTVHLFLTKPRIDEGKIPIIHQNSIGSRFRRDRSLVSNFAVAVLPALYRTANWVPAQLVAFPG